MNFKAFYTNLLLAAITFMIATSASAGPLDANSKQTAATVDDVKITVGEIDSLIMTNPQFQGIRPALEKNEEQLTKVREMVMESLIDRVLMLRAAQASSMVSEADAEKKLDEMIEKNGGEEELKKHLKARNTDYDSFKKNMKYDLLISDYISNELAKDIEVSNEDAKKAFDSNPERYGKPAQVQARHILLKVDDSDPKKTEDAVEKEINKIHAQVTSDGADFSQIAAKVSECPSAQKGGDLGYFVKQQMVPPFADAAFALETGEISSPVKTQFGYHIIKVEDKKPAVSPDFSTAKPTIVKQLEAQAKADVAQKKIKELRSAAKIDISLANKG